jgi:dihydrofolate reductase
MRTLASAFFVSLDGVVESPEQWHFPYLNGEMEAEIGRGLSEADALLMGRVNYQEWAAYWPNAGPELEIADRINSVRKYVVSTTLDTVDWQNSTLINGDIPARLRALKEEPGGKIAMSGSATLARSLLREGLIDELQLMIHPVVVGRGARLFDGWSDHTGLQLVEARTFKTGVQYNTYRLADS